MFGLKQLIDERLAEFAVEPEPVLQQIEVLKLLNQNPTRLQLPSANLAGLNLSGIAAPGANFQHTNFTGCLLEDAEFSRANLRCALLSGPSLSLLFLRPPSRSELPSSPPIFPLPLLSGKAQAWIPLARLTDRGACGRA